ncbi:MFS transporter [Faecalicoccus pleomorphus]|uniref:MFS transporter n=1 Tax=Faecalicoccus pleomorphus TaxID=1323 RepID=UPI0026EE76C8|nr:MFS transporter [Faecalicoccus pleomorphus]
MQKEQKRGFVLALGLLILSLVIACNTALSPILADLGKAFPNASDSSIQIVLTLINLLTVPIMLFEPYLERWITKRTIALLGLILMCIGALIPQFLNRELWMLYINSIIIGTGYSLVTVTSSSLICDYFSGLEKSRVMGYQSIFASIGGTVVAQGSGYLTFHWGWECGYLILLITIPIFLAVISMVPKGVVQIHKKDESSTKFDVHLLYFAILCLLTGLFVATFNTNIAMYLDRNHIGDANTAGLVAAIMQCTGILGGLLLGPIVKKCKRLTIGISLLLMALGTLLVGISVHFTWICLGSLFMGIGFAIRNPAAVTFAANLVSSKKASLAIAIVSATYNFGIFLSAYVLNPLSSIFSESIGTRYILSGIGMAIVGILACIKAPTTDQQALDSQSSDS